MKSYNEKFQTEALDFMFLAGKEDSKILVSDYKRENVGEFVRLACLALTLGYNKLFLKILNTVQDDCEYFLTRLNEVEFGQLENWFSAFIDGVKDGEAQELCRLLWEERKKQLDANNFRIKHLF